MGCFTQVLSFSVDRISTHILHTELITRGELRATTRGLLRWAEFEQCVVHINSTLLHRLPQSPCFQCRFLIHVDMNMYIYIYRERERDRESCMNNKKIGAYDNMLPTDVHHMWRPIFCHVLQCFARRTNCNRKYLSLWGSVSFTPALHVGSNLWIYGTHKQSHWMMIILHTTILPYCVKHAKNGWVAGFFFWGYHP